MFVWVLNTPLKTLQIFCSTISSITEFTALTLSEFSEGFFVRLFPLLVFFFCFFVIADVVIAILYFNKLECSKEINRILPIFHKYVMKAIVAALLLLCFFFIIIILFIYLFIYLLFFCFLFFFADCRLTSLLKKETGGSFPLTPENLVSFWCGYLNLLNSRIESCNCKLL